MHLSFYLFTSLNFSSFCCSLPCGSWRRKMLESQFANHPHSKPPTAVFFSIIQLKTCSQCWKQKMVLEKYRHLGVLCFPQLFKIPEFVRLRRVCGVFWDGVDSSFSYTSKVTKQKRVYRYWRCLPGRKAIFLIDAFRTFASSVSGCIGFALFLHARKRIFIPGANQLIEFTNYKKHQETTNQCFIMFPPMCYAVWVCVSCRLTGAEVEAEFERLLAKAMCSESRLEK